MCPLPRLLLPFALLPLLTAATVLPAQTDATLPSKKTPQAQQMPRMPKPPALVDAAGPAVSLESSEAMFDVGVALNACGYDAGLAQSDPIRHQVREQFDQEAQSSSAVRTARDQMCKFIDQHRLFEGARDLAQYVSLALYLTPPPALELSVDQQDLPPDALQVVDMVPVLQNFAQVAQLHLMWLRFHPEYEAELDKLHDPLTQMVLNTNLYLKLPLSTYTDSRFLVVLEPLLDPNQTNAREYGANYVVVAAPVNGVVDMHDIRHTYLHYEIEPLLYSRANSMDRLLPILKTVSDAPLSWEYRGDIVSLVTECLIRAVEARTMETGVVIFNIPANAPRVDLPHLQHQRDLTVERDQAVREALVTKDMREGFVLTRYFYNQLGPFEHSPESLAQAIGPMVYGMDVEQVVGQAKHVSFLQQAPGDVISNPLSGRGLDRAEAQLKAGNAEAAGTLAMQALKDHTADPARADYILALTWLMKGDMDSAVNDFDETLRLTQDPRLLAWSHIFLGRIDDVRDQRPEALAQYQTAMQVRDGQPDTLAAAQQGLKQPYTLPGANAATAPPQQ